MSKQFDVVIIGGGMGGLLLAWILGQKGRNVALVERQTDLRPPARGELIQPNGIRILDRFGLLEGIRKLPHEKVHRFHFHGIGKGRLCSVDYRVLPAPWNFSLVTTPAHLLPFLLEKLRSLKSVTVFTGTEFKEAVKEGDRIVGVQVEAEKEKFRLSGRVVVGSDGAFSRVREALEIPSRVHIYKEGYLTMVIPRPDEFPDEGRYFVGRGKILGVFPVSKEELYLFYMVKGADLDRIREGRLVSVNDAIGSIDSMLSKSLEGIRSWNQVGYMPTIRVRARTWVKNGAALIGDSAHAMNPHVAQGRNQAMEDAQELARVIEDGFEKDDFSRNHLFSYEAGRRPTVEGLQKMGDELTLLWNAGFFPVTWLRDRIFRGMDRNPRVRTRVIENISGLNIRPLPILDRIKVLFT